MKISFRTARHFATPAIVYSFDDKELYVAAGPFLLIIEFKPGKIWPS